MPTYYELHRDTAYYTQTGDRSTTYSQVPPPSNVYISAGNEATILACFPDQGPNHPVTPVALNAIENWLATTDIEPNLLLKATSISDLENAISLGLVQRNIHEQKEPGLYPWFRFTGLGLAFLAASQYLHMPQNAQIICVDALWNQSPNGMGQADIKTERLSEDATRPNAQIVIWEVKRSLVLTREMVHATMTFLRQRQWITAQGLYEHAAHKVFSNALNQVCSSC